MVIVNIKYDDSNNSFMQSADHVDAMCKGASQYETRSRMYTDLILLIEIRNNNNMSM